MSIQTTTDLQLQYAVLTDSQFIDQYIPLNETVEEMKEQKEKAKECECDFESAVYWENENHSHGWCCPNCGKVLQWG